MKKKPNTRKPTPKALVGQDRLIRRLRLETSDFKRKYGQLLSEHERLEKRHDAMLAKRMKPGEIKLSPTSKRDDEAVAIAVLSDWHIEEDIRSNSSNFGNQFSLAIAKKRSEECFVNIVKLLRQEQFSVEINTLVVALLGDFINGNIHDELMESNLLLPMEAMLMAEELIEAGINYLLKHTDVKLVFPCCAGNHSRITRKQRIATEYGNSLETIMYHHLAKRFARQDRVRFIIADSYHLYFPVYDNYTIRFHHGHQLRFQGGVGGLYIPARKAIAQWQKIRRADLDVFGHFHNLKMDGDLFICNGSLVGYNDFALSIKADFEKPKQAFFLVDRKRGKTGFYPIVFSS